MNEGLFGDVMRGVALIRAAGVNFTQVARGLSTAVTRTGAGIYVVTLLVATPSANCRSILTIYGGADSRGTIVHTSDTVKTITTFGPVVSAAVDVDFDVQFDQIVG